MFGFAVGGVIVGDFAKIRVDRLSPLSPIYVGGSDRTRPSRHAHVHLFPHILSYKDNKLTYTHINREERP